VEDVSGGVVDEVSAGEPKEAMSRDSRAACASTQGKCGCSVSGFLGGQVDDHRSRARRGASRARRSRDMVAERH